MNLLGQALALPSGEILPNRIIKSAMSEVLADPASGAPTDRLVRLYERWGRGGAGTLITGHVIVHRSGLGEPGNVMIEDDRHLAALTRWASAAQANGARLWMQLNHAGRQAPRRVVAEPLAPSPVAMRGFFGAFARPRALGEAEIARLVDHFASAAAVARAAGFAGVQLHGAHGYLISQFLSPRTNQRTDGWGGELAGRMRFLLEVVRAVRAAVGPAFPIGVKLNSADFQRGGFTIDDAMAVARALEAAGIDLLEVSGGNYESPAMAGSGELPAAQRDSSVQREAYFLDYARRIRGVTKLPIMLTGGMRSAAVMQEAIASGAIDAVGLARPMAFEPDLPAGLIAGRLAGATPTRIRSRVKKIDDMLQVFWFQAQMHRMADGQEPLPGLGRWSALWKGLRATFLGMRRAPRGELPLLPAPAEA